MNTHHFSSVMPYGMLADMSFSSSPPPPPPSHTH